MSGPESAGAGESAPEPEPEQAKPPEPAEPIVDISEDSTPYEPETEDEGPPAAESTEEKVRLEADDPDATYASARGPTAEDDAFADGETLNARTDGFRRSETHVSGERAKVFQADTVNYFAEEVSARPRSGPVPTRFLRSLLGSFAVPDCQRDLLENLPVFPCQCLVGPPGTGRTTLALATLAEYARRNRRGLANSVHILATTRGLVAFDSGSLPKDTGFVLVLRPDEPAIDAAWLASVAENMRRLNGVLIVVTTVEPEGSTALNADKVLYYTPPTPAAVFRSHLGAAGLDTFAVEALLAVPEVQRELDQCRRPREAALLARDLLIARKKGVPPEEAINDREPEDQMSDVRKDLKTKPFWQRTFLITAAVLEEQTAGTVAREAVTFAELRDVSGSEAREGRIEWFLGPMAEWSGVVTLVGEPTGDDGSGRTVRLSHPRLAELILREVWQDHLGERDTLLTWLQSVGAHPDSRVRVRAAQTAAQLAGYDYDVIMREVVRVWALDGAYRTRQTASWALESLALADGGRFARKVRGLVRNWAGGGNVQLMATAATVYGTYLGVKDPDEALLRMRRIVGVKVLQWDGRQHPVLDHVERQLANIVEQALVNMFAAGAEEKVVEELDEWTRLPDWRWHRSAARCLLRLARRKGRSRGWPVLMELAAEQPEIREQVVRLWCNALGSEDNRTAWEALHRWILLVEKAAERALSDTPGSPADKASDSRLVDLVETLLHEIRATGTAIEKSFDFHVRLWEFRDRRKLTVVPR